MLASEIRALFAVASRPGGRVARRRHAEHRRPPARRGRRRARQGARRPRRGRAAVRLRPGRPAAARADLRGHGARGHPGARRRRGGHGRLPAGPRPGHPDLLRPGRRRAGRGAVLRRGAVGVPVLPGRGRARRDGRRRAAARRPAGRDRRRSSGACAGRSCSTRCRTSTTRPASRWRGAAGRRSSRSASPPA